MQGSLEDRVIGRAWHPLATLSFVFGLVLIVTGAFLDWSGYCWKAERQILRLGSPTLVPHGSGTVLLTLPSERRGFHAMDVSLALRGLEILHPRCIVINGSVEPSENEGLMILPDLIAQLEGDHLHPVQVIIPVTPSSGAVFRPVPIPIRLEFPSKNGWPLLEGKADIFGGAFLPSEKESTQGGLQFFGTVSGGHVVGSTWWWTLPEAQVHPLRMTLWFSHFLSLPNHAVLPINHEGSLSSVPLGEVKIVSLDDFLLGVELRERGTIRPDFDALWKGSTVVIGEEKDLTKAEQLQGALEETLLRRLPLSMQSLLMIGCSALMMFLVHLDRPARIIHGLIILLFASVVDFFLISHGLMLPLLPFLSLFLSLLLPWDIPVERIREKRKA